MIYNISLVYKNDKDKFPILNNYIFQIRKIIKKKNNYLMDYPHSFNQNNN